MFTGLTQMHDLAATHMRDRQRSARERATRLAARRGRHPHPRRKQSASR
ncbi:MAG: hypothetical protein ACTHOK_02430 [Nocardioidaceae bacterium]